MYRFLTQWLLIASALWCAILIDQWVAANVGSAVYLRVGLVGGIAACTLLGRRSSASITHSTPLNEIRACDEPSDRYLTRELHRELALAIEHIESILVVLQVSIAHKQPVPRAVPANLNLVRKHLEIVRGRVDDDVQSELSVQRDESLANSQLRSVSTHTDWSL